ncbi:MAG: N-acetylneuraminate synthase family protein [Spirochaetes bacterium]|nr:N-acetylneuraminate synthase family protein [Spirochaetota bacterium]
MKRGIDDIVHSSEGRPFFIAEIGLNHNGDAAAAGRMIDAAAGIGVGGVKFQTLVPELLNSVHARGLLEHGTEGEADTSAVDFFRRLSLTAGEMAALKERADRRGVLFFSSVFDGPSLELLEGVGVPLYKLASSEITNLPLIEAVADTGKPAIISTGICSEEEIGEAVAAFRRRSGAYLALLHCVSRYPLPPEEVNLARIISLRRRFHLDVGFSDHTDGIHACAFAASLGSRIFEKHFTLHDTWDCPDSAVSLSPVRFREMMELTELAVRMQGDGTITHGSGESETARAARRSLFARRDIPAGKVIEPEDLVALRPGIGIQPNRIAEVLGRRARCRIDKNMMIRREHYE